MDEIKSGLVPFPDPAGNQKPVPVIYTNDKDGLFFTDRYYLDSDGDEHYFETIEELAEVISEIVGHPVGETFKECEKALENHMEGNPDEWYSLHEFQICDD